MADNLKSTQKILRSGQYTVESSKYIVHAPKVFRKTKEQEIDESSSRIEELRNEIRKLEQDLDIKLEKSETEAEEIIEKAEAEAERLIKQAEKSAFDRVQSSLDEKEQVLVEQDHESQEIISKAQNEALQKVQEAEEKTNSILEEAKKKGYEQGKMEGFNEARKEVAHMVERLHSVIDASMDERERIFVHSERQIINLVMTMVEKVVKKLTQEDKDMVIHNVKEALSLVRGAMQVFIHVNPDDFNYTLENKKELIKMIEGNPQVKFLENPSVGRGGVYIETDLGEIDATIATQLDDIQEQIKYYMPVKVSSNIKRPLSSRAQKAQDEAQDLPEVPPASPVEGKESKVVGNPYWDNTSDVIIPAPASVSPPPEKKEERVETPPQAPAQQPPREEVPMTKEVETPRDTEDFLPDDMDNSLEQSMLISDDHEAELLNDGPFQDETETLDAEIISPDEPMDEVAFEELVDLDSLSALNDDETERE